MKKAGIILLCLQALAVFGGIVNGSLMSMGIVELVGFCIPSVIGIILLVKAKKKSKQ